MKPTGRDLETRGPEAGYESTLHLVAHAPVPDGLEERVHAALQAAPRRGRILAWPRAAGWAPALTRVAAAAAIVMVVAGGGWSAYRHAQLRPAAKVVVMPVPQVAAPATGGFSNAGAMRTPQTVKGPAVVEMPKPKAAKKHRIAKPASAIEPAADAAQPVAAGTSK